MEDRGIVPLQLVSRDPLRKGSAKAVLGGQGALGVEGSAHGLGPVSFAAVLLDDLGLGDGLKFLFGPIIQPIRLAALNVGVRVNLQVGILQVGGIDRGTFS